MGSTMSNYNVNVNPGSISVGACIPMRGEVSQFGELEPVNPAAHKHLVKMGFKLESRSPSGRDWYVRGPKRGVHGDDGGAASVGPADDHRGIRFDNAGDLLDYQVVSKAKKETSQHAERDLFGNEIKPKFVKGTFENNTGKQQTLFNTKGKADQMNLIADTGIPDEMVQKREGKVVTGEAKPEKSHTHKLAHSLATAVLGDLTRSSFSVGRDSFTDAYKRLSDEDRNEVKKHLADRGLVHPVTARKRTPIPGHQLMQHVIDTANRAKLDHSDKPLNRHVRFADSDYYKHATKE